MTTCVHCGSGVREVAPSAPPTVVSTRLARGTGAQTSLDEHDAARRLARVIEHPDYAAAMSFGPPTASWLDLALPVVMAASGALAMVRALQALGLGIAAVLVAGFGTPWFVGAITLARAAWRDRGGCLSRRVAMVCGERVVVRPLRPGYRAVELQLDSGGRAQLQCHPDLAAMLARGDVGVAYVKGERLIAFCRFDV